jgi:hypothetical protein
MAALFAAIALLNQRMGGTFLGMIRLDLYRHAAPRLAGVL